VSQSIYHLSIFLDARREEEKVGQERERGEERRGEKRREERADVKDKRHYIRLMSKASAVPVEPQEQTNLLEESILAPGVIGGTVPGGKSLSSRQATFLYFLSISFLSLHLRGKGYERGSCESESLSGKEGVNRETNVQRADTTP